MWGWWWWWCFFCKGPATTRTTGRGVAAHFSLPSPSAGKGRRYRPAAVLPALESRENPGVVSSIRMPPISDPISFFSIREEEEEEEEEKHDDDEEPQEEEDTVVVVVVVGFSTFLPHEGGERDKDREASLLLRGGNDGVPRPSPCVACSNDKGGRAEKRERGEVGEMEVERERETRAMTTGHECRRFVWTHRRGEGEVAAPSQLARRGMEEDGGTGDGDGCRVFFTSSFFSSNAWSAVPSFASSFRVSLRCFGGGGGGGGYPPASEHHHHDAAPPLGTPPWDERSGGEASSLAVGGTCFVAAAVVALCFWMTAAAFATVSPCRGRKEKERVASRSSPSAERRGGEEEGGASTTAEEEDFFPTSAFLLSSIRSGGRRGVRLPSS